MYKVLLVDDEPMALEMLKYVVDWDKLEFSICGTCYSGEEAVENIEKYQPDVIITDIRMPVMDGLELIRYARENGKENIKFIVVSGYGEFEYAKKAMKYGVRYYLQKPVLQEEIYEIIIELKEQLNQLSRSNESVEMDQKALIYGVLGQLLQGNDTQKVIEYLKSFVNYDMLLMEWNCIVIDLEQCAQMDINDGLKMTRFEVRKVIEKVIKSDQGIFVLEQSSNRFIILINLKNEELYKCKVKDIAENIFQSLLSVVISGFTIGVGENVLGINNVKHSYNTALTALEHRFYKDLNCVIFYNDIKENAFNFEFNDIFMSSKVLEAIEESDINKINNLIDTTFEYFIIHRIDPDIVIMFTSNMMFKLNNLTYQSESKEKGFTGNHTICELEDHERTILELKKFFQDFCLECCERLKEARNRNGGGNIAKIEVFIKENYKRNITLRELAENVYMHPAYLGQLFLQKFGMSFNEYIHKLRIDEAKRLMYGTNLKNHEIAEGLGYCNYNSFLQQFQKSTGMKPTEFRNGIN